MKQRITYLVEDPDSFTPEQLEVKDGSLSLRGLKAVQEHRITFSLDELPTELRTTLKQWQELHIKWASLKPYTAIPPFTSRVSPGLHVSFTPHKSQPKGQLCDLLHTVFDPAAKCSSGTDADEVATPLIHADEDGNEKPSASLQYYSYLPTLNKLASFIEETLCPPSSTTCIEYATSLLEASYLDIDYSAPAPILTLTALSTPPPAGWTTILTSPHSIHTTEVGVLTHEPNPDPEDLAFAGFLTVLGPSAAPKPTRFQAPARHYPLSASPGLSYTARFTHPTGLHPTLEVSFDGKLEPPAESCALYTYLTLPSYLFIDKYQFADPLFLSAQNLVALQRVSGATDLEAPDWVVPQWGSAALFELAVPPPPEEDAKDKAAGGNWTSRIPLHLRYLPASPRSHTPVPVPWPVVFWGCAAEQDSAGNPFDRVNLGYDGAFGAGTRFMHVPPEASGNGTGELVSWIDVPVLDTSAAGWVETGTIGVVVCAFVGLCWVLFSDRGKQEIKAEKKKQ
ncbi:PIG-X-domain-containing protein [Karstenula rhodostoma CBS 690.94]|uniref:Protein PBN1 n=1 Tax=Karstenula rhodostoma CBS 690.94 TaxID=1392251 RepID=A0A9P4PKZ2_9PLEO|nr:PIG-X-domain-containing protein [Karstenula rhodostoma CBS 690.94]